MKQRSIFKLCSLFGVLCSVGSASNLALTWQTMLEPGEVASPADIRAEASVEKRIEKLAVSEALVVTPEQLKPGVIHTEELVKYSLTPDIILNSLREEVTTYFHLEGELHLFPSERLLKHEVPDANWYVELVAPYPAALSSRMALRYRFTNGYDVLPTEMVTVRAEWWREAIVAQRQMRPGEVDAETSSEIKKVNWLLYRGDLVEAETKLSTLELKTTWRSNEPLRWSQVKTRPMIESGSIVDVIASDGPLKITMRGVATQSGNAGELISVRNMQSRKEIQGVITNANTVLVVF